MSDLIVITYDKEQTGRDALDELANLQKMQLLELEDAALAVKDDKGKVKVKQTLENQVAGTSAVWGGFWGLLIGLPVWRADGLHLWQGGRHRHRR